MDYLNEIEDKDMLMSQEMKSESSLKSLFSSFKGYKKPITLKDIILDIKSSNEREKNNAYGYKPMMKDMMLEPIPEADY